MEALGVVLSAKLGLVSLPRAKAVLVVQFAGLLESLAATPLIFPRSIGGRSHGQVHP
jgi:hypothetical protein